MAKKCKLIITAVVIALTVFIIPANKAEASGLLGGAGYEGDYPTENYTLDYYSGFDAGDVLPWNLGDTTAKSVYFFIYIITSMIWTVNVYMCDILGVVINEAYSFDIIGGLADKIGSALQGMAGVYPSGISADGLYARLLLFLIVILGAWSVYTGLIKRETSKAVSGITSFILIFVISGAAIAYAPSIIKQVNGFSNDISGALLDVGGRYLLGSDGNDSSNDDGGSDGNDSSNYIQDIRDMLWDMQVHIPWLILEFGVSDPDAVGGDRLDAILRNPENSDERNDAVKAEAENGNAYMVMVGAKERCMRCGLFVLLNLGISVFVFIMCVIMIFSQLMFLFYVMLLPVCFLISMIPGYGSYARKALEKVFNCILTRAGMVFIVTCSFFLSSVVWQFSGIMDKSSIIISMVLQAVIFGGIFFILGDLMGMFHLSLDSKQMADRMVGHHVQHIVRRSTHAVIYGLKKSAVKAGLASTGIGAAAVAAGDGAKTVSKASKTAKAARQTVTAGSGSGPDKKVTGTGNSGGNSPGINSPDSAVPRRVNTSGKNSTGPASPDKNPDVKNNTGPASSGKKHVQNNNTVNMVPSARPNDARFNELMKEADSPRPAYRRAELLARNTLPVAERRANIARAQDEYHNSITVTENRDTASVLDGTKAGMREVAAVKKDSGQAKSGHRPLLNHKKAGSDSRHGRGGRK